VAAEATYVTDGLLLRKIGVCAYVGYGGSPLPLYSRRRSGVSLRTLLTSAYSRTIVIGGDGERLRDGAP
jgi:hypothetical protein